MISALLGLALATTPVDPFDEPDESELFRLDEQLVTVAARYAQSIRKAPSIVAVVDADEIRARGYRTLSDLLRDLPGIYVWKSPEGRDLASFRGVISADNNKILLLVDGVPWYDGTYTHAFVDEYLPLANVRQVEVIKGPGSAIYGTNAFSGVINVVTFSGSDLGGARIRLTGGSGGRAEVTATAGGVRRVGGVDVEANATVRLLGAFGDGVDVTPRNRRDILGHDPKRGLVVGGAVAAAGLEVQVHHVDYAHTYLVNEADDPYDRLAKDLDAFGLYYRDTFGSLAWKAKLGTLTLKPGAWAQRHDNPGAYYFRTGYEVTEEDGTITVQEGLVTVETAKDTRRWGLGLDLDWRPTFAHHTVAGVGFENVEVLELVDRQFVDFSTTGEDQAFRAPAGSALRNLFGYAQHTWTIASPIEVVAGLRVDKRIPANGEDGASGAFAIFPSPRAGVLLAPADWLVAKVLYGRAFRSGSVRELLVTVQPDENGDYPFTTGDIGLLPESIDTAEAELALTPEGPVEARLGGSYSVLSNEVDKVDGRYANLESRLGIVAAEAAVTGTFGTATLDASYALTLARYQGGAYDGRPQYEFPAHMLKGRLHLALGSRSSFSLLGEAYAPRPRQAWTPDARLDDGRAFGLLHAHLRVGDIGPDGRIEAIFGVRNLTGTRWGNGMYRDDANALSGGAAKYPVEIEGEGRFVHAGVEVRL
jgi:iron complex outermembrane receptor protein